MSPKERKALMILNDVEPTALAKRLGVTPTLIYMVRTDRGRSRRVESALAKACGVPLHEMFPEPCNRRSAA